MQKKFVFGFLLLETFMRESSIMIQGLCRVCERSEREKGFGDRRN